jgi:ZIP family zinc transporter
VIASTMAGAALPLALAAAAGAMLWVVGHELFPAALRSGRENGGRAGLLGGFALMTTLAVAL